MSKLSWREHRLAPLLVFALIYCSGSLAMRVVFANSGGDHQVLGILKKKQPDPHFPESVSCRGLSLSASGSLVRPWLAGDRRRKSQNAYPCLLP